MRIAIIDGSTVKQIGEHQVLFPNTSFSRLGPTDDFLSENNAKKVITPTYAQATQKLNSVTAFIDGDYVKEYEVVSLTTDEKTEVDNVQWEKIREERTQKLKDSDWTQVSDSPLDSSKKTEWQTYRQSLRDITTQSDPFNITWATEPT
tara:strand:- start:28 stop:471 length:444 start_codon:yes stop_codon:yes gene_type:complete